MTYQRILDSVQFAKQQNKQVTTIGDEDEAPVKLEIQNSKINQELLETANVKVKDKDSQEAEESEDDAAMQSNEQYPISAWPCTRPWLI